MFKQFLPEFRARTNALKTVAHPLSGLALRGNVRIKRVVFVTVRVGLMIVILYYLHVAPMHNLIYRTTYSEVADAACKASRKPKLKTESQGIGGFTIV